MTKFYSKRKRNQPTELIYHLADDVRSRILSTFEDYLRDQFCIEDLLAMVGRELRKAYGYLSRSGYDAANVSDHPVVNHFYLCDDDHALDFIEACFQCKAYSGKQLGVDAINEIFQEVGIGYELTPWIERGRKIKTADQLEVEFPIIIRKDDQWVHEQVIEPVLRILSDREFTVAYEEFVDALKAYRHDEFADCMTSCCSSFESTLKTICAGNNWEYDPNKDTCSRLVAMCKDKGLFHPFYAPLFESVGTIRNKLGDAHGRGPKNMYDVMPMHAKHYLSSTASHILFLHDCYQAGK